MLPDGILIFAIVSFVFLIVLIASLLSKKLSVIFEIMLNVALIAYLFIEFPFREAILLFSIGATAYSNFSLLIDNDKNKKKDQLVYRLRISNYKTLMQVQDYKRLVIDLLLTIIVSSGAIVFYLFAPETYIVLKILILIGLITIFVQTIGRIGSFLTTRLYWLPSEERLFVLSAFEAKDYPIHDLEELRRESAPDLLRLHPLFTLLSENIDYTTSFRPVLKLSFPGEHIFLTPDNIEKWDHIFRAYTEADKEETKRILPVWHPQNLKRLFWKGYFAATVKGISAYTTLLLILIWLQVPSYIIIAFVLIWWVFNLYIADRVLIAATDAEEVVDEDLRVRANRIFDKANIQQTKLYVIDSPIYNGLATGMNIGKGTIMLTKATTQLSTEAVEAVIAHEAMHVKKRDVLVNQIARMLFFVLMALLVYVFFDYVQLLAKNLFIFIPLFYLLMILFPVYLSFVAQWTEMRADYLGTKLLDKGANQMKRGLHELANAQDQAFDKSAEYNMVTENRVKVKRMDERDNLFFRIIEFQFQAHPPMYYRISSLKKCRDWAETRKNWIISRLSESLPDRFGKKSKINR